MGTSGSGATEESDLKERECCICCRLELTAKLSRLGGRINNHIKQVNWKGHDKLNFNCFTIATEYQRLVNHLIFSVCLQSPSLFSSSSREIIPRLKSFACRDPHFSASSTYLPPGFKRNVLRISRSWGKTFRFRQVLRKVGCTTSRMQPTAPPTRLICPSRGVHFDQR